MKINQDLLIGDTNGQLKDILTTTYDTENVPCKIGTWNGKPIYRIILNLGYLPNGTQQNQKIFNFELPKLYGFISSSWFAYNGDTRVSLPYVFPDDVFQDYWMTIEYITNDSIMICCGSDRSAWRLWGMVDYVATEEI